MQFNLYPLSYKTNSEYMFSTWIQLYSIRSLINSQVCLFLKSLKFLKELHLTFGSPGLSSSSIKISRLWDLKDASICLCIMGATIGISNHLSNILKLWWIMVFLMQPSLWWLRWFQLRRNAHERATISFLKDFSLKYWWAADASKGLSKLLEK